ncbi:12070_t:CDS:2 [Funneliformis caledonium]|uniref:Ras modification protein ERF4 n=1 Tax=Funneliformis caledonium TaxID=1117310 RepID=A0A9N8Z399_9GLOM|nr:12070_t:CDS:2 [Funneliformis caledonium]
MDNKVGQDDKQKYVAEEKVAPSWKRETQVEGEKEDGNTYSSMVATTSTQNAVIGNTSQLSTTEVGAKTTSSLESPKAQTALQLDHILTSQTISTTSSSPYKSKTMFFQPENHNSSDSQFHTHYSDTNVSPKSREIVEDSMLALRLAEMESSSSSISPEQPDALSSNLNTSEAVEPKQIIRIDRDYTSGELCQFQTAFPLEIDGRVNPRRFQQTINILNEMLTKAHNPRYNMFDNCLACLTIYTSTLCLRSHFDRWKKYVNF